MSQDPPAEAAAAAPAEEAAPAAEAAAPAEAPAEEVTYSVPDTTEISYSIDSLFLFISAVLVIFMQAGFALVEIGLNSAKNAVNILFKNSIDFCIGVLLFYVCGTLAMLSQISLQRSLPTT
jgi:Amt family ammonium transporter